MEKLLIGVVDETMENVHSSGDRARSVPRGVEKPKVVRMEHGGCQSCFRDRTTHCIQRFRNEEEMDRCSVLGEEDHSAVR